MNDDYIERARQRRMEYERQVEENWKKEKQRRKEKLAELTSVLVEGLNAIWEYEDVWERAQLKKGTQTVIQIIDGRTNEVRDDERIVLSNDGVRIEIGSSRYKIKTWGMRGVESYDVSAEIINAIYKVLND